MDVRIASVWLAADGLENFPRANVSDHILAYTDLMDVNLRGGSTVPLSLSLSIELITTPPEYKLRIFGLHNRKSGGHKSSSGSRREAPVSAG